MPVALYVSKVLRNLYVRKVLRNLYVSKVPRNLEARRTLLIFVGPLHEIPLLEQPEYLERTRYLVRELGL